MDTQNMIRKRGVVPALAISLLFVLSILQAQENGRITGIVVEEGTRSSLWGANVVLVGTTRGAATDNQGYYLISNVPPGDYEIAVNYIGYADVSSNVQVEAGQTVTLDFVMRSTVIELSELVVTAERLAQSQTTAINAQFNAPNIKSVVASDLMGSFPDHQAVEAMARIPGVSLTRDQGEGDMPIVRGLPPAWSSTTINGERIPSAHDEGGRSVRLNQIPAELIQRIEVSKSLTPDMDADAIGGTVDLITKDAPGRRLFTFSAIGGFTGREGVKMGQLDHIGPLQFAVNLGDNLMDGKFGYLVSGSYNKATVSTINRTWEYDWKYGPGKEELKDQAGNVLEDGLYYTKLKQYEIERVRAGVNGSLLYKPWLGHKFYLRGFYSTRLNDQFKWSLKTKYNKARAERETDRCFQPKYTTNITTGGDHTFANDMKLDYHLTYSQSKGSFDQQSGFIRSSWTQKFKDLDKPWAWDDNEFKDRNYRDRDYIGALNLEVPFVAGAANGYLKFGGKVRSKDRHQKRLMFIAEPAEGEPAWELPGGPNTDQYHDFFTFDPPVKTIYYSKSEPDENYNASERILAGYAMSVIWFGQRFMLLPGVRMEHTKLSYDTKAGHAAENNFAAVLPSVQLRYMFTDNFNVRLAATKSLARPEYYALVPYDEWNEDRDERSMGNPDLKPTRATNFDLLFERYSPMMAGIISLGVFYKQIDDPIETVTWVDNNVEISQPQNTGEATVKGVELSVQERLGFIGLRNVGIVANYTYLKSEVKMPDGTTRSLAATSDNVANLAVSYENPKIGLSSQLSYQFIGKMLESTGEGGRDIWEDNYKRLDFKLSQKLTQNVRFVFEAINLTNAPLNWIIQKPDGSWTTNEKELYGRTFVAGFELEL